MCTYISAIVPKSAELNRLSAIAASFGKDLRTFSNASIERQLTDAESLFLTARGHCDCDSAIGSNTHSRRKSRDLDEERSSLARKGWSNAKIERALSQRMEKILMREQDLNSLRAKDLESWLGFLRTALGSKDVPYVGLLTHHYSGYIEAEDVSVADRRVVVAADLNEATLASIEEDVIYRFAVRATHEEWR